MPLVVLAPLTLAERRAFTAAQIADYADWLVDRGGEADRDAALARARVEIEAEVETALQAGESFWAAHNAQGDTVGWLWVKPASAAAFLYQILVRVEFRRQGYASAMLAALEDVLAAAGRSELRLNVWDSNVAALGLYTRAGYELVERFPSKRQLGKRLQPR